MEKGFSQELIKGHLWGISRDVDKTAPLPVAPSTDKHSASKPASVHCCPLVLTLAPRSVSLLLPALVLGSVWVAA